MDPPAPHDEDQGSMECRAGMSRGNVARGGRATGPCLGAARAAVVARFGARLDLVEEVHLMNLLRPARLAGIDGANPVVPEEAGHDVASALQDLLVGQIDAVARLQDADSFGNILQEQTNGHDWNSLGLLSRTGRFP